MKTIYCTQERKGFGKQNYNHNEYRQEGNKVYKYRCNRHKFFDGKENNWEESEKLVESWGKGDPKIPEWLSKFIKELQTELSPG